MSHGSDALRQRRHRMVGIGLMCCAVALFAVLDTTAKYLNTQMDSLEVTWARYTSAFVLTLFVSNPLTHLLRIVGGIAPCFAPLARERGAAGAVGRTAIWLCRPLTANRR